MRANGLGSSKIASRHKSRNSRKRFLRFWSLFGSGSRGCQCWLILGVVWLNFMVHAFWCMNFGLDPSKWTLRDSFVENNPNVQKGLKLLSEEASRKQKDFHEAPYEVFPIHTLDVYDMEFGHGWFQKGELKEEGQEWEEHDEDGTVKFRFIEQIGDQEQLQMFDKPRNIAVRVRFLERMTSYITPVVEFIQNPSEENTHWTYMDKICDPGTRGRVGYKMKPCSRALKGVDDVNREIVGRNPIPIHYVFSVTATQYFEWQSRYHVYWFRKTQKKTSKITRLLAAARNDHLGGDIPTFVTRHYNASVDDYAAYNKPMSVIQWLDAGFPVEEDIVAIMDVDMCYLEDLTHLAVDVKEGSPVSQTGFMWFPNANSTFDMLAEQFCHNCSDKVIDTIAVPIFIHKNDLRKIAPKWLEKTKEIRAVTRHGLKGYQQDKELQLSWAPEMYGYIFAAAEMGLVHQTRGNIQDYTIGGETPRKRKLHAPTIHFSYYSVIKDNQRWSKTLENASYADFEPDPKNEVSSKLLAEIKDAYHHMPPTGHKYNGYRTREF